VWEDAAERAVLRCTCLRCGGVGASLRGSSGGQRYDQGPKSRIALAGARGVRGRRSHVEGLYVADAMIDAEHNIGYPPTASGCCRSNANAKVHHAFIPGLCALQRHRRLDGLDSATYHCGHMWELAVPHLPSRVIDFKGLARDQFYTSS